MKMNIILRAFALTFALAIFAPLSTFAQQESKDGGQEKSGGVMNKIFGQDPKDKKDKDAKPAAQAEQQTSQSSSGNVKQAATNQTTPASGVSPQLQAGRREQVSEEEAAIVPYYNNYLKNYILGPEDVISIEIFNQPRYSKTGITVPPDGRISFYLIPEGVRVVGKTTQQVQEEIQKRLDEYIIDPQVTVYLDKAMSARYSVLGDVSKPGIMIMTRRVSVMEALAEAGGVLNTGDKSKVVILRHRADGSVYAKLVNVSAIEKGKVRDVDYLVPGDQVVVPGNRLKSIQQLTQFVPILAFGRIFGLPF